MTMYENAVGTSGVTPDDLREVARSWDASAEACKDYPELAARDRRFAAAMRKAADILDTPQ